MSSNTTLVIIPANIRRFLLGCEEDATSYFTPIPGDDIDHIVAAIGVAPEGIQKLHDFLNLGENTSEKGEDILVAVRGANGRPSKFLAFTYGNFEIFMDENNASGIDDREFMISLWLTIALENYHTANASK